MYFCMFIVVRSKICAKVIKIIGSRKYFCNYFARKPKIFKALP